MTRPILTLAAVLLPALASGQAAPAGTTGAASKPSGGSATTAIMAAQNTLHSIQKFCKLSTLDGKLVAACNDTSREARAERLVPDNVREWGVFAKKLADADATVNGKPRAVVILNRGEMIAEVTASGLLRLKN